jgi:two-component system, NarL family, nitrate/nitrite response regulator NarL
MVNVLLVDDHPMILSGVESLLKGTLFAPVAHASNGLDVEAALQHHHVDIIVLDLNLPGMTGIIILTAEIADETMLEAYQLGIEGLVVKQAAPDLLLNCLEEVRRGGRWIDQTVLQRALTIALDKKSGTDGLSALSPREREIVDLVTAGARNQEISASLGITPGTVKVHLHRIYEKLGVSNRADLVIYTRDRAGR